SDDPSPPPAPPPSGPPATASPTSPSASQTANSALAAPSRSTGADGRDGHGDDGAGGGGGGSGPEDGVGVPPGGSFAGGGDCVSCPKPTLQRGNQDTYNDGNHPFKGWLSGLLGNFIGRDPDETVSHFGEMLNLVGDIV